MKGIFYSALLPKWQKKLGAPQPSEKFHDLYERARTVERHDQHFQASAVGRSEKKDGQPSKPATVTKSADSGALTSE